MAARIYQQPKNAMQSGRFGTQSWFLEFEPREAKRPDPLMGWAGSGDTRQQLKLRFPDVDAAKAYAAKYGIDAHVIPVPPRTLKI